MAGIKIFFNCPLLPLPALNLLARIDPMAAHLMMYFLLNIVFVASGFQIQLGGLPAGWD